MLFIYFTINLLIFKSANQRDQWWKWTWRKRNTRNEIDKIYWINNLFQLTMLLWVTQYLLSTATWPGQLATWWGRRTWKSLNEIDKIYSIHNLFRSSVILWFSWYLLIVTACAGPESHPKRKKDME